MNNSQTIYVYDSFTSSIPVLMGKLCIDIIKGKEAYSFEYDSAWLDANPCKFNIDPDIMPYEGRQYSSNQTVFGLFADASPDRWGRMLMMKKENEFILHPL